MRKLFEVYRLLDHGKPEDRIQALGYLDREIGRNPDTPVSDEVMSEFRVIIGLDKS